MKAHQRYLEMAREALEEAELMIAHEHYRAAISRAYYASFYAVQAALESIGVSAKSHQGALVMFSKHFIKTEILPKHFAKHLQGNLDQRLLGDYEIGFKAERQDAEIAAEYAETVIAGIEKMLEDTDISG